MVLYVQNEVGMQGCKSKFSVDCTKNSFVVDEYYNIF